MPVSDPARADEASFCTPKAFQLLAGGRAKRKPPEIVITACRPRRWSQIHQDSRAATTSGVGVFIL